MKPVATSKITARERNTGRRINAHGGNGLGTRIAAEAHAHDIPVSVLCAVIEQESEFRNVFGHDGTRSIPDRWKGGKVTAFKYWYYKRRRSTHGAQGVGPGQLTSPGYQDQADADGGCRHTDVNIATMAGILASLFKSNGGNWHRALECFNAGHTGTAAGKKYAERVMERQRRWHGRLV